MSVSQTTADPWPKLPDRVKLLVAVPTYDGRVHGDVMRYVAGLEVGQPVLVPYVGDVITHPRFVDPTTNLPVPVRVLHIHRGWAGQEQILAVVVTRASPH